MPIETSSPPGASPVAQDVPRRARGKVLVVDDHPDMLAGCADLIAQLGYEVATAANGMEAIEIVRGNGIDVVVSDICMPGMNGMELLRAVREHDLDLPVVMMTASPEIQTAVKAIEYGAIRYLIKPFGVQDLSQAVEHAHRIHAIARVKRRALEEMGVVGVQASDLAGMEASFERALRSLWMAYQPIVRRGSLEVFGYEALVRAEEPGLPHPGALFAASERLNRLNDLGRAIRAAVATAIPRAPADAIFFVNLHARELCDDTLFLPSSALSREASRVVLEITERASVEQVRDMQYRVLELRKMGFRIAVDDLGAGYAGLTSLAHLEPEVVKLDMTLVRDSPREPVKRKLIGSIAGLCREMGTLVVAEGIETEEERDVVSGLGCELLQGYLLGRPAKRFEGA